MASCRIVNLKPDCGYSVEGINQILLLDFDDLARLGFEGDDLYNNCLVTGIYHNGEVVELDTPDSAKYVSAMASGLYAHTLDTFIGALSSPFLSNLHLATKRRYFVMFRTREGKYFGFGWDAGAQLSYANQTAEAVGSLVTLNAASAYPLFEISAEAVNSLTPYAVTYVPEYVTGGYCIKATDTSNSNTGNRQAVIAFAASDPSGLPLDINGLPVSDTGNLQAIMLLNGRLNPDADLYEVAGYFNEGDYVTGNPTQIYDTDNCPVGYLRIFPTTLILSPSVESGTFTLISANPWQLLSFPSIAVTVTPTTGALGSYNITATRGTGAGQGYFIFQDLVTLETAQIYIINTPSPSAWILETGNWNMLGFWVNTGLWNF